MLLESRLYSFIDQTNGFTVHFVEGQKFISDMAITHGLKAEGFQFFRDSLLAFQHMIAFLKPGESLGIYVDSDTPYFRFKLEMNEIGQMRTLLLPDDFNQFPKLINGKCRVVKTVPHETHPYTSVVDLVNTSLEDVVNKILRDSYQLQSQIFLSTTSDQSLMISKLPSINIQKIQTNYNMSVKEFWSKNYEAFAQVFSAHSQAYAEIQQSFEACNLLLLSSKQITFQCNCSRERMVNGIMSLIRSSGIDQVFLPEETEIETKCDYCKSVYILKKAEFLN